MGVGLRPSGKPMDLPPNPKVARVAFLSKLRGRLGNWPFYLNSLMLSASAFLRFPLEALL
jgi:hypothetical protein